MAHELPSPRIDLGEFLGDLRAKLVRKARSSGLPPAAAEDCAQDAITALLDLLDREPDRQEDLQKLRGWLYLKAESLQIDYHRRAKVRAEESLTRSTEEEGERPYEPMSNGPSQEQSLQDRELVERLFVHFFSELGKRARLDLVRCLLALARSLFPRDHVDQFLFARILVFSGKGADKRSAEDVESIARALGKSKGAMLTDLSRLQSQWRLIERDVFCVPKSWESHPDGKNTPPLPPT
jgi:DNA-directed RNA polymerase specialized sigma24 family protein